MTVRMRLSMEERYGIGIGIWDTTGKDIGISRLVTRIRDGVLDDIEKGIERGNGYERGFGTRLWTLVRDLG